MSPSVLLLDVNETLSDLSPMGERFAEVGLPAHLAPTRFGASASQLQAFIDTLGPIWQAGELADKVYVGFTSSQTEHGGQETTLLSLYQAIMHWGGILVTPGYTDPVKFKDGNPYGVSHVTGADNDAPLEEVDLEALDHMAERAIRVAAKLAA